jgi:hypothetical protein
MIAVRKSKTHQGDYDRAKRARMHHEEALDDALKNTFQHPTQFHRATDPASRRRRQNVR